MIFVLFNLADSLASWARIQGKSYGGCFGRSCNPNLKESAVKAVTIGVDSWFELDGGHEHPSDGAY
jgi:hypothetical protein